MIDFLSLSAWVPSLLHLLTHTHLSPYLLYGPAESKQNFHRFAGKTMDCAGCTPTVTQLVHGRTRDSCIDFCCFYLPLVRSRLSPRFFCFRVGFLWFTLVAQ